MNVKALVTWSSIGRCIGASDPRSPKSSQISKAVKCSVKKVELLAIVKDWLLRGSGREDEIKEI